MLPSQFVCFSQFNNVASNISLSWAAPLNCHSTPLSLQAYFDRNTVKIKRAHGIVLRIS